MDRPGDFQRVSGYGCPINKATIKYWSVVNLIGNSSSACVVLRYIAENSLFDIKRCSENRTRICLALLAMNFGSTIYSAAKIYDQERYAYGCDAVVATGFSLAMLGGVFSFSSYLTIVLKFFKGYSKIIDNKRREKFVKMGDILQRIINPCRAICVLQVLVFYVAMIVMRQKNMQILIYLVLGTFNEIIAIYGSLSYYLIALFLREVKSYLRQVKDSNHGKLTEAAQDLQSLYKKVWVFQIVVISFFPSAIISVFVFISIPFMQRRILYLTAFLPSCTFLLSLAMIYSLTQMSGKGPKGRPMIPIKTTSVTPYYSRHQKYVGHLNSLLRIGEVNKKIHIVSRKSAIIVPVQSKSDVLC